MEVYKTILEKSVGKTVSVFFAQKTRIVKFVEVSQFGYIFEILEDDHNYVNGQLIFFNHSTPLEINLL